MKIEVDIINLPCWKDQLEGTILVNCMYNSEEFAYNQSHKINWWLIVNAAKVEIYIIVLGIVISMLLFSLIGIYMYKLNVTF